MLEIQMHGMTLTRPIIDGEIDANIRGLVTRLNELPGLATIGCCGGHDRPVPTQHEAGRWFVTFEYLANRQGREAVETVRRAVEARPGVTLEINKWSHNPLLREGALDGRGDPRLFEWCLARVSENAAAQYSPRIAAEQLPLFTGPLPKLDIVSLGDLGS